MGNAQYNYIYNRSIRGRYSQQQQSARIRGIPFLLTFEQWLSVWHHSGKLTQRGRGCGLYCMARIGDQGGYEIGNIKICLNEENKAEQRSLTGKDHPAFGKNYWTRFSKTKQNNIRAKIRTGNLGKPKPKSRQTRLLLSIAATGRKKIIRHGRRTWAHPGDPDYPT